MPEGIAQNRLLLDDLIAQNRLLIDDFNIEDDDFAFRLPRDSMEDYRHLMDQRPFPRGGFDPDFLDDDFGDDLPPFAVVPAPNKVK